jgi:hypothetical protein
MRTPALDVIVTILLIPAFPILITWFLPWERWIPKLVPKKIIGPYLIYSGFAAWYFGLPVWLDVCVALFGSIVFVIAIVEGKGKKPSGCTE